MLKDEEIGERIRRLREEKGWSLRQAGGRAGLSHTQIDMLERGRSSGSVQTLTQVARAYGLRLSELLGLEEEDAEDELEMQLVDFVREIRMLPQGEGLEALEWARALVMTQKLLGRGQARVLGVTKEEEEADEGRRGKKKRA